MTLDKHLEEFYRQNGIPADGGYDKDHFDFKVFGINLKLPNPEFRKKVLHIHDLEHVLNGCDTSWKGEAYIAGWEISTGMWRYFPILFFSLWAMGYSLWIYPRTVFQGYKGGWSKIGLMDLPISKEAYLKMEMDELKDRIQKPGKTDGNTAQKLGFLVWVVLSQVLFLTPLALILWGLWFLIF